MTKNNTQTSVSAIAAPKKARGSKLLFATAAVATVVAAFYTIENWRGRRAWLHARQELISKGYSLDFSTFSPPRVPEASNFLKAGPLEEWFRKEPSKTNSLSRMPRLPAGLTSIPPTMDELRSWPAMRRALMADSPFPLADQTISPAAALLQWLDQYREEFAMLHAAAKRPDARFDFDYTRGVETEIPNFVHVRTVAQAIAAHAKASLVVGRPEDALEDLAVLCSLKRAMASSPTLVGAMIGVAIGGLHIGVVQDGLRSNLWREPQLTAIEAQLSSFRFLSEVTVAMRGGELANVLTFLNDATRSRLSDVFYTGKGLEGIANRLMLRLAPRGWIEQNMAAYSHLTINALEIVDPDTERVYPAKESVVGRQLEETLGSGPYRFIAAFCTPNFLKAFERAAQSQMMARLGQVACALERYRLDHGQYPVDLSALTPGLIATLPRDASTGEPLVYRRGESVGYTLYSRGWDMLDSGGGKDDWVWPSPEK